MLSSIDPRPDVSTPNFDPSCNRDLIPRAIRNGPSKIIQLHILYHTVDTKHNEIIILTHQQN